MPFLHDSMFALSVTAFQADGIILNHINGFKSFTEPQMIYKAWNDLVVAFTLTIRILTGYGNDIVGHVKQSSGDQ